ncbi:ATP-dependent protease ATPase subunit HslU [Lentilactobacillus laojiaonis]|uniref:ATP-dependent protease ATPase subunit HslU n=1 Tax=Lentilactobacillus laojiaonis TaxID=2883998 RepID=UPI001D0B5EC2|nr:ATP-dependent protease ATPase subunit HslU [Lentilactobacillus laojiaonis]UDM32672.1 ATP-dependent protease ATPase subunit HslU [Lentilactobacillus laojiaonis]
MNETNLTPKKIVSILDQYVIGQDTAKKSVAIALRNRQRRMLLSEQMQEEISPKNLLMIGPTGVGKTEIARRLAKIVDAPFVKVEATKFTEVGYVGGDVESMIRDLVENAVQLEKDIAYKDVHADAVRQANEQLAKLLVPAKSKNKNNDDQSANNFMEMLNKIQKGEMPNLDLNEKTEEVTEEVKTERQRVLDKLNAGLLENDQVEILVDKPTANVGGQNEMLNQMGIDLNDTLSNIMPKQQIKRTTSVKDAREILTNQIQENLVDQNDLSYKAIKRAEDTGIVFIDEIDKITGSGKQNNGEVSREGVQRDILPIVEGTKVKTKYGMVDTNHILFIGSGAFANSKPSDLIPELQGRFPIRVELNDLSAEDFVKILTEPNNALIKQYIALIGTDNIKVTFTKEAVEAIAAIAADVNKNTDNIGARRLHTILEKLLEDILYEGPDMQMGEITITEQYVNDKVGNLAKDQNLSRYIL